MKLAYVTKSTTEYQILAAIRELEHELNENKHLTAIDRAALHDHLDYLYSFVDNRETV